MDELCARLGEILEVDEVKPGDKLGSFELWDSLAVLSLIAWLDANRGVNLTADEVRNQETVSDLNALIDSRRK
jgi:acyl carrier protein